MVKSKSVSRKKVKKFDFRSFLFFFLLGFLVVSVFIFGFRLYSAYSVIDVRQVDFTLNVSDYVGLNVDSDGLHFGTVFPGGSSSRSVVLKSGVEGFVFVKSDFDWLFVREQGFFIGEGDERSIDLKVNVPLDADFEDFEGVIYFYVMRSDSRFLTFFLEGDIVKTFDVVKMTSSKIFVNVSD